MVSRLCLFLRIPPPSGLTTWNYGCPEFSKVSTICDARRSHLPPFSAAYPWYHLLSSPGPKNAQCASLKFEAYSLIFLEVRAQESSLSFLSSSRTLNMEWNGFSRRSRGYDQADWVKKKKTTQQLRETDPWVLVMSINRTRWLDKLRPAGASSGGWTEGPMAPVETTDAATVD